MSSFSISENFDVNRLPLIDKLDVGTCVNKSQRNSNILPINTHKNSKNMFSHSQSATLNTSGVNLCFNDLNRLHTPVTDPTFRTLHFA